MVDLAKFEALPWRSGTPSMQEVVGNVHNPARLVKRSAYTAFESTMIAGGRAWLSRMKRTGAEPASASALAAFDTFVTELDDLGEAAAEWLKVGRAASACAEGDCGDLFDATLSAMQDAILGATAEMPVLRGVIGFVGLAVAVGQMIWVEAQGSLGLDYAQPLTLDKEADQADGDAVMGQLTAKDWTSLFLPEHDPSQGGYLQGKDVRYASAHEGIVMWIGSEQGEVTPLGDGLIPGQSSVARLWQSRQQQATTGSTRLDALAKSLKIPIAAGKGYEQLTVYEYGYFRPSLPQLGQIIWSQIQKPGPDMFRVDARMLRDVWDNYWRIWLVSCSQLIQDGRMKKAELVWRVCTGNWLTLGQFQDWKKELLQKPGAWGDRLADVPEEYVDLVHMSMQPTGEHGWLPGVGEFPIFGPVLGEGFSRMVTMRGVTRRYCNNLLERQAATIRTVECAYLTGNEPGLKGALLREWKENRTKLLDHPAKASVDLEQVPATDYTGTSEWRDELIKRRLGGTLKLAP